MKPSEKSPNMEKALTHAFGFSRADAIKADVCIPTPMGCGKPVGEFYDELSRKEYTISGRCQSCQDIVFARDEGMDYE